MFCIAVCCQTVVGSNQPIVIFTQQPQQPYFSVPQVDPVITSSIPGEQMSVISETNCSEQKREHLVTLRLLRV